MILINGQRYECEPAVEAYIKDLQAENEEQRREILRLTDEISKLDNAYYIAETAKNKLKAENARLEEGYQKSVGVIAATDCAECKDREYLKAYNDVMMLRANIQEIIEDVSKKNGDVNNESNN